MLSSTPTANHHRIHLLATVQVSHAIEYFERHKLAPAQADTQPPEPTNLAEHQIRRKQILGGLTHEYHIAA